MFLLCRAAGQVVVDDGFVKWCIQHDLKADLQTYCSSLERNTSIDTANYYWAQYYLWTGNADSFYSAFQHSKDLCLNDTTMLNRASALMLANFSPISHQWFTELKGLNRSFFSDEMSRIYGWVICEPRDSVPAFFDGELRVSAQQLVNIDKKKKWGVIWRNLIFPGWGRAYLGRKRSGASSAVNTAGLALASFEVARQLGAKHPFAIINMSGFVLLYFSELTGGVRELRLIKTERKKQFLYDASNHYRLLVNRR